VPLLERGPEVSPSGLFDLSAADLPWAVAHTRSRQEKALARHLEPLGIGFYLPQREKRVRRSGRQFLSYIPLFPGYLFLRADAATRSAVFRTRLVVRLLEVRDQDLLHEELRQLRRLQEAGATMVPFAPLVPGDLVTVDEGPFRGYRGRVLREQSGLRLVVSVSILRQNVAIEFDRSCLTRVGRGVAAGEEESAVA
jgi:transcription antitermination factor NusG